MSRREVVAWAIVDAQDGSLVHLLYSKHQLKPDLLNGELERVVKLVEHDPRADAVVRAAVKWLGVVSRRSVELMADVDGPLAAAIKRYRKGQR